MVANFEVPGCAH